MDNMQIYSYISGGSSGEPVDYDKIRQMIEQYVQSYTAEALQSVTADISTINSDLASKASVDSVNVLSTAVDNLKTEVSSKIELSDVTTDNLTGTLSIAKGGTGATTRSAAFKNLSFENYTCTKLSSDGRYYIDLDNFTEAGSYYVKANSNDYPIMSTKERIVNGWLTVIPSGSTQIKQIFYRFGSVAGNNDYQTYVRTYFPTGWTEWVKLVTEKDLVTTTTNGLMSSADKAKLDSIEVNAGLSSVKGEEPSMDTMDIPKEEEFI